MEEDIAKIDIFWHVFLKIAYNLQFLNVLKMIRSHGLMGVMELSINPQSSEDCIFQTLLPTFERTLLSFSWTVMSDSLQPHGRQHARLPCPSPSPRACSNSCPLSWWCHSTNSFSVVPFFSHFQSIPASGSLLMSWLFTSGDQSIRASASTSTLPVNIQDWSPLGLTGLISLQSKGLSRVFSNTTVQKHQFFTTQPSLWSSFHIHTSLLEKPWLYYTDLCGQSNVSPF